MDGARTLRRSGGGRRARQRGQQGGGPHMARQALLALQCIILTCKTASKRLGADFQAHPSRTGALCGCSSSQVSYTTVRARDGALPAALAHCPGPVARSRPLSAAQPTCRAADRTRSGGHCAGRSCTPLAAAPPPPLARRPPHCVSALSPLLGCTTALPLTACLPSPTHNTQAPSTAASGPGQQQPAAAAAAAAKPAAAAAPPCR